MLLPCGFRQGVHQHAGAVVTGFVGLAFQRFVLVLLHKVLGLELLRLGFLILVVRVLVQSVHAPYARGFSERLRGALREIHGH